MAGAVAVARHPRLKVLALETRLGTRYTADTLARLARWPGHRFVWLMGADNLAQLPRWWKWRGILAGCPVAVFERHPYSYRGAVRAGGPRLCRGDGCRRTARTSWRSRHRRLGCSCGCGPHPASATAIRAGRADG